VAAVASALTVFLALPGYGLRAATAADAAFERILFETARQDAACFAAWPAEMRKPFLDQQFHFQTTHYARSYPHAFRGIIEGRRERIGRIIVDRAAGEWRVVDVALLPLWRGHGVGGALLRAIQAEAAQVGAAVALTVDMHNRARRLYERLGFHVTEDSMPNIAMAWRSALS
jgi:GNAT superfamily N-acetyltransferase